MEDVAAFWLVLFWLRFYGLMSVNLFAGTKLGLMAGVQPPDAPAIPYPQDNRIKSARIPFQA